MGANRRPLRHIRIGDKDARPGNIDRDSDAWRGTMSNVHTTYHLCGRNRSEQAMCGTKSAGG